MGICPSRYQPRYGFFFNNNSRQWWWYWDGSWWQWTDGIDINDEWHLVSHSTRHAWYGINPYQWMESYISRIDFKLVRQWPWWQFFWVFYTIFLFLWNIQFGHVWSMLWKLTFSNSHMHSHCSFQSHTLHQEVVLLMSKYMSWFALLRLVLTLQRYRFQVLDRNCISCKLKT